MAGSSAEHGSGKCGIVGKRVLVVGGASGIGRASAARLAAGGARVALADVAREEGQETNDECAGFGASSRYWHCDIADEAAVSAVLAEATSWLGGLDAVVHVAGIVQGNDLPVDKLDRAVWDRVMSVNLTGAFHVVKHAAPHLERSRGAVVLVGSGAGVFSPHASTPYAVSKGGLHALALTLEEDLRARGIRINDVAPGRVDTPLLRREAGDERVDQQLANGEAIPAEQVAALIAFLVSDDAAGVRGTVRTW